MLFCLIIALLSSLLWVNVTIADIINHSKMDSKQSLNAAKVKTALVAIAALFWAIVIRYGGI